MEKLYDNILNFDLISIIKKWYKKKDTPFWYALFTALITLSIIFIFHSSHLLFGDHDWQYLKDGVPLNAGLFEGRFTQFILINILSYGKILPIINNTIGLFGFSLGIALLAKYWTLPHKRLTYTLFALFTALTPYILSFMYFAFLIIPVLSWSAFIIGGLIISKNEENFSFKRSFLSSLIFATCLGGYPPIINLYAVALSTRMLLDLVYEKSTIKKLIKTYRYSIINFLIGAIIYKLVIIYLTFSGAINSNYYNLQTTPINEWGVKFLLVIEVLYKQFITTLPFIELPYKIATLFITILALYTVLKKRTLNQSICNFLAITIVFLSGLITLFLSTSIAETKFSPRIDFFGLMYCYSAMYAIILKSQNKLIKNISTTLAIFCMIYNTNVLCNAQKVWKLGFNAELSLYKRVIKRYEQDELFSLYNKYTIIQGGAPSFRPKYYHQEYDQKSDDLLSISYIPGMNSGVMWNYYGQADYADTTSYVYTTKLDQELKEALNKAKVWPHQNSVMLLRNKILLILTPEGLAYLHKFFF